MNRRTFLKSVAASAVLTKLGLQPAKSLALQTRGTAALTLDQNQMPLGNLTTDGTGMFVIVSTPTGEAAYFYRAWSGAEKRPFAS